jgi:putative RecB family exonuclease
MAEAVLRLSPLRLRVFAGCRLRYRYQYIEKRRPRLRLQDTAGTLVHNVLCDFFAKTPTDQRTGERLLSMFDQRWAALSPRYLRIPSVGSLHRRARAQLERFAIEADLKATPLLIEEHFQVELAPDVLLVGRVDRVDEERDGSLSVLDYKTGEPPEEIDPRQLYLYAVMVERQLKRPVSRGTFWYLEEGRQHSIVLDESGKARAAERALAAARQMQSAQEFPPSIGRRCVYCPYHAVCDYKAEIAQRRQSEGW